MKPLLLALVRRYPAPILERAILALGVAFVIGQIVLIVLVLG